MFKRLDARTCKAFRLTILVRPHKPAPFEELETLRGDAASPEVVEHLWHPNPFVHLVVDARILADTAVLLVLRIVDLIDAAYAFAVTYTTFVDAALPGITDLDTVKLMAHIGHCLAVVDVAQHNQEASAFVLRSMEFDLRCCQPSLPFNVSQSFNSRPHLYMSHTYAIVESEATPPRVFAE